MQKFQPRHIYEIGLSYRYGYLSGFIVMYIKTRPNHITKVPELVFEAVAASWPEWPTRLKYGIGQFWKRNGRTFVSYEPGNVSKDREIKLEELPLYLDMETKYPTFDLLLKGEYARPNERMKSNA